MLPLGLLTWALAKLERGHSRTATLLRARSLLLRGQAQRGQQLLRELTRRSPESAEPWLLIGHSLLNQALLDCPLTESESLARVAEAEGAFDQALTCDPDNPQAQEARERVEAWRYQPVLAAWGLFYANQPGSALDQFYRCREQLGARIPLRYCNEITKAVGWCLYNLKRYVEADAEFETVLCHSPNDAQAIKGRGLCAYFADDYEQAHGLLALALGHDAKLFDAHAFMGWCDYSRQRFDEAAASFSQALGLNPEDADSHYGAGMCAWESGRQIEAGHHFARALTAPAHPLAQTVRKLIAANPELTPVPSESPTSTPIPEQEAPLEHAYS